MKHQEFYFRSHNKQLFGQYWEPQQIRAVVVLVHGMGEHSGRYSHFVVPELVDKGFAVIGFDHFGHGHSEVKLGHCPNYQAVLDSVTDILNKAKDFFGDRPTFLYGHSMGGNVVINYAMRRNPEIRGVIATSPLLRLAFEPPKWKMTIGSMLQKIFPSITMRSGIEVSAISRDDIEVKKYRDDILVHDKVSPNFTFPFFEAGEWAIAKSHTLKAPLLLMHGTADRITDHKASIAFAKEAPHTTLKLYDEGYHELHNDLERKDVLKTITDWIESKL